MATIKVRKQSNGTTRYTAVVRVRKGKAIIHCEARTFTLRSAAASWAKHREVALENPEDLRRIQEQKAESADEFLLRKLIRWYIDTFKNVGKKRYANLRPENVREIHRQLTNVVRLPDRPWRKNPKPIAPSPAADRSVRQGPPH